jgi:SAM-dependent methyltransferase
MSSVDDALKGLQQFFDHKIREHGTSARGVDWKNEEAQFLRFEQLMKVVRDRSERFSIIDYGCGYGALIDYLDAAGFLYDYIGYDFTPAVIEAAQEKYGRLPNVRFTTELAALQPADYVVSSGVMNMKINASDEEWEAHVRQVIDTQWRLCTRAIAFNCLTSYSDPEYMRPDLYYGSPLAYFDHCKRHLSRNVALLHDYGTYDWTMIVRR